MFLPRNPVAATGVLVLLLDSAAAAQPAVWIGGALHHGTERFDEDVVPNRLDGSAAGWTLLAGLEPWRHVALRVEWARGGVIEDSDAVSVDVDGRVVTIRSTLAHRTDTLSVLAGYTHRIGARVRLAYLAGAAVTRVPRTFATNAPALILIGPSDRQASGQARRTDTFVAWVAGLDARIAVARHLDVVAGARGQALRLDPDPAGWSIKALTGVAWTF